MTNDLQLKFGDRVEINTELSCFEVYRTKSDQEYDDIEKTFDQLIDKYRT